MENNFFNLIQSNGFTLDLLFVPFALPATTSALKLAARRPHQRLDSTALSTGGAECTLGLAVGSGTTESQRVGSSWTFKGKLIKGDALATSLNSRGSGDSGLVRCIC